MTVQTRTARYEITETARKGGWTMIENPFGDVFFTRGKATLQVRYSRGGGIALLAYSGSQPIRPEFHLYRGVQRRAAACEILRHTCTRHQPDGDFCGTCGEYSRD